MTRTAQIDPAEHLAARLAETAENLASGGILDAREIATALISTGVTVARTAFGPVAAAQWLRETADAMEASDNARIN